VYCNNVPSDLTEAESCEDFEPVQIATKHKAKKVSPAYTGARIICNNLDPQAGGHSTKCKASAPMPAQKSSRK